MKYCAFLRGVNVKGTAMKMSDVCSVFSSAGLQDVSSVLASGNIIFSSDKNSEKLKIILKKAVSAHFSYDAFLFIKSEKQIQKIFADSPFPADAKMHHHIFVGEDAVAEMLFDEFKKCIPSENERAKIIHNTLYWQIPKGATLDSDFGKILGRKDLKSQFTSRNINTFEKILKKI